MSSLIESSWRAASERSTSANLNEDGFIIYRLDDTAPRGVFGGVDVDGALLLAIETTIVPPSIDLRSDAIDCFRRERKEQKTWLLVVRLKKADLTAVFSKLTNDLIDSISGLDQDREVIDVFGTRMRLWQKLFEARESGLLADYEIKGLIAELLYVRRELKSGARSALEIVHSWLGPTGADQDFIFSDASVEVKAIGPSSEGVSISSLQQLQADKPLQLSVWTLRQSAPSELHSWNVNQLTLDIERRLSSSPSALAVFRDRLLSAGYVTHCFYESVAFEPMSEESFAVNDRFPRITEATVPAGIRAASYVISLHSIRSAQ